MAIRLNQIHPAFVHLPITLLPLAIGADLLGRISGVRSLQSLGRDAIVLAAAGAAAAAVTGLIAGEEVNAEGEARDALMTHRNLNFVATLLTASLALLRSRRRRAASAGYLAAGAAGIGVVAYTAYLGGKLVYDHGVGVASAGGVYRPDAPALGDGRAGQFLADAGTDLVHGVQHMAQEMSQGKLAPTLMAAGRKHGSGDDEAQD